MDSAAQENITQTQVISLTHCWPSSFTPTPAIFLHSLASSSCFQLVLCLLQLTRNYFSFTHGLPSFINANRDFIFFPIPSCLPHFQIWFFWAGNQMLTLLLQASFWPWRTLGGSVLMAALVGRERRSREREIWSASGLSSGLFYDCLETRFELEEDTRIYLTYCLNTPQFFSIITA